MYQIESRRAGKQSTVRGCKFNHMFRFSFEVQVEILIEVQIDVSKDRQNFCLVF